ncbi:MAG: hypothetical protein Tsb0015_02190 [Simkaniaceae bacterium]
MNIILFGFKKCGKSTYGKKLAEALKLSFIDTDQVLESLFEVEFNLKLPCREIFQKVGERRFRLLEREAVLSLQEVHNSVIAVGGGSMLDPLIVTFLDQIGTLVYLKLNKETVKKRLLSEPLPAYIDPNNPEESFEEHYEKRKERFDRIPAKILDLEGKDDKEVLNSLKEIYKKIGEKSHGEQ